MPTLPPAAHAPRVLVQFGVSLPDGTPAPTAAAREALWDAGAVPDTEEAPGVWLAYVSPEHPAAHTDVADYATDTYLEDLGWVAVTAESL